MHMCRDIEPLEKLMLVIKHHQCHQPAYSNMLPFQQPLTVFFLIRLLSTLVSALVLK